MPTLSHTFLLNDQVWVVDPSGPAIFHGTIVEILLDHYRDNTNTVVDKVLYTILLDNSRGTLKSTEDYMSLVQADCMLILADLVDNNPC